MPRPLKWRKVCCLPERNQFGPLGAEANLENFVKMTVDEYETIRLIDLEDLTQEEYELIIQTAKKLGIKIKYRNINTNEISNFEEIFITNAIKGIVPIFQIDNHKLSPKNPITKKLLKLYLQN